MKRESLRLAGSPNFRDIGGYPTESGESVRFGRVFRSDKLSHLTSDDSRILDEIGIRSIFDLRSTPERERHPTVPQYQDRIIAWPMATPGGAQISHMRTMMDDPVLVKDFMLGAHRKGLPAPMTGALADMMQALSEGAMPCIVHCTFGKDRTGLAIAVILSALGVSRDHIRDDYLISNQYRGTRESMLTSWFPGITSDEMERIPLESTEALLVADADYLDGAIDAMAAKHGSMTAYIEKELGLGAEGIKRLRSHLLER